MKMLDPELGGKLGTPASQRVAAGAQLPTPWIFEPAKRPDDRTDYCLERPFILPRNDGSFNPE